MDRNDSGMLTEEEWLAYISLKAQFNEIFGVKNESTHKTESSTNEATEHKAE